MKIKAKKRKLGVIWYILGIGSLVLAFLFIVSSVINIGEKFNRIPKYGEYIEYGFYGIILFFILIFIIIPIVKILKAPSISMVTELEDGEKRKYYSVYKKIAKNILKNNELKEEHRILLTKYKGFDELRLNLQLVFDSCIKKELNSIILKHAKIVMLSTAISQNAKVDMITVYGVNIKMIKELVVKCGFRPSIRNLSKLSINVLSTALIADGLEKISFDEIFPQGSLGILENVPLIKPVMSSVTQGIANALLTLRIGMVSRKYLFKDGNDVTQELIRKNAWKESAKLIPTLVSDTFTFVPKKIIGLFKKDKEKSTEEVKA